MQELISRSSRLAPRSPHELYLLMCGIGLGVAMTLAMLNVAGLIAGATWHTLTR